MDDEQEAVDSADVAVGVDSQFAGDGLADALGVFTDSVTEPAPEQEQEGADTQVPEENPRTATPAPPSQDGADSPPVAPSPADVINIDGREYEIGDGPGQLSDRQASHLERVERSRREFQARADRSEAELDRLRKQVTEQPQVPQAAEAQQPQERPKVPLPAAIAERAAHIDRETGFEEDGGGITALVEDLWSELLSHYVAPLARRVSESASTSREDNDRVQIRQLTETYEGAKGLDPDALFTAFRVRQQILSEEEGLSLDRVMSSRSYQRLAVLDAIEYLRGQSGDSVESDDAVAKDDDVRYVRGGSSSGRRAPTSPRMGVRGGGGRGFDVYKSPDELIYG